MNLTLLFISIIIFVCIACNRFSGKLGVPGLFIFIVLGMIFGSDGIFKIPFDNYEFANELCSIALIFIMFYGGFGTKWSTARPVAAKAILLSSFGTAITAILVGLFCRFVLHFDLLESFLLGAIICSTDAASVFSILRSKKINLKYGTAPMLEVESGSNDPFSYMLTVILLTLMQGGEFSSSAVIWLLSKQIVFGVLCGFGIAYIAKIILSRYHLTEAGFDSVFVVGVAIFAYVLPTFIDGNGYLSVYIAGIMLGNSKMPNKKGLVHFFDGITNFMQMLLFFLLGLLAFPSRMPAIAFTALLVVLFLTFIARPVAVFMVLSPFKCKLRQQLFVAWSGMRGVASIVFAIMSMSSPVMLSNDMFHIIFFIVLFSILIQGTLLPQVARWLKMIDKSGDVMTTFTDYLDDIPVQFIKFKLYKNHKWNGRTISQITLPPECILVLIIRDNQKIVPKGNTVLCANDIMILSGKSGGELESVNLYEHKVSPKDRYINKKVAEISNDNQLLILIRRRNHVIIPKGDTLLKNGDILVINDAQ